MKVLIYLLTSYRFQLSNAKSTGYSIVEVKTKHCRGSKGENPRSALIQRNDTELAALLDWLIVQLLPADAEDFFDKAHEEPVISPPLPSPRSRPTTPREAPAPSIPAEKNEDKIQQALSVGNYAAALDACFEVPHPPETCCDYFFCFLYPIP